MDFNKQCISIAVTMVQLTLDAPYMSVLLRTRGLEGLIGIACKYPFDALEKESILLCKNGLRCFESVKDG